VSLNGHKKHEKAQKEKKSLSNPVPATGQTGIEIGPVRFFVPFCVFCGYLFAAHFGRWVIPPTAPGSL
jgi:hypothetical protein